MDPATLNLVPETIAPRLSARTRAVVLVDQAGVPADLDAVRALCEPRGIVVVEDAACAAGAVYRGRPAGATAAIAAFSFHPRKVITTGEGSMIVTPDGALAARLRRLRSTIPGLTTITDPPYGSTNFQGFWVMLPDDFPVGRNALLSLLADAGVSARRGVMAAHLEPAYADQPCPPLPVTERVTAGSLILPLFHTMTQAEQDRVVSVLLAAAARRASEVGA